MTEREQLAPTVEFNIEIAAQRFRDERNRDAEYGRCEYCTTPSESTGKAGQNDSGYRAAERNTGLLEGEYEIEPIRRRHARQDVGGGRRDRPVTGTDEHGRGGHRRGRTECRHREPGAAQHD